MICRKQRTAGSARPSPRCGPLARGFTVLTYTKLGLTQWVGTSTVPLSLDGAPRSYRGLTESIEKMSESLDCECADDIKLDTRGGLYLC